MICRLPELPIKPGCGRASDRHSNSDSQATAALKIIPNNPDVHPGPRRRARFCQSLGVASNSDLRAVDS